MMGTPGVCDGNTYVINHLPNTRGGGGGAHWMVTLASKNIFCTECIHSYRKRLVAVIAAKGGTTRF